MTHHRPHPDRRRVDPAPAGSARARLVAALVGLLSMSACTGGINAGTQGGRAFVAFTGMLLVTVIALYLAIGRGD